MAKTKVGSYVRETIALMKGDKDEAIAENNFRKATSAVQGQIFAIKGKTVDLELIVESRQEELRVARYPKELINSPEEYLSNIKLAERSLEQSEKDLAANKKKEEDMRELLSILEAE